MKNGIKEGQGMGVKVIKTEQSGIENKPDFSNVKYHVFNSFIEKIEFAKEEAKNAFIFVKDEYHFMSYGKHLSEEDVEIANIEFEKYWNKRLKHFNKLLKIK